MQVTTEPRTRAWNDVKWRDLYMHIVDDDEHAADMLAEVFADIDQRHPYALCGVSLVVFGGGPYVDLPRPYCPECLELNGGAVPTR